MRLLFFVFVLGCATKSPATSCEYQKFKMTDRPAGYGEIVTLPCGESMVQIKGEVYIKR